MRKRLFRYITMALSLWIFLGGSIGQVYAQDEFNPTPPPEPGKLTLLLSTDPLIWSKRIPPAFMIRVRK